MWWNSLPITFSLTNRHNALGERCPLISDVTKQCWGAHGEAVFPQGGGVVACIPICPKPRFLLVASKGKSGSNSLNLRAFAFPYWPDSSSVLDALFWHEKHAKQQPNPISEAGSELGLVSSPPVLSPRICTRATNSFLIDRIFIPGCDRPWRILVIMMVPSCKLAQLCFSYAEVQA